MRCALTTLWRIRKIISSSSGSSRAAASKEGIQQAKTCTSLAIQKEALATCRVGSAEFSETGCLQWFCCFDHSQSLPSAIAKNCQNLSLDYLLRQCLASAMVATDKAARLMVTI